MFSFLLRLFSTACWSLCALRRLYHGYALISETQQPHVEVDYELDVVHEENTKDPKTWRIIKAMAMVVLRQTSRAYVRMADMVHSVGSFVPSA